MEVVARLVGGFVLGVLYIVFGHRGQIDGPVAEVVVRSDAYRTWVVFSTNRVVTAFAPATILMSSMAQLTVLELWFLRDEWEQGVIVNDEDAASFTDENGVVLWQIPLHSRNGRL